MVCEYRTVPLACIAQEDTVFRITSRTAIDDITHSIQTIGLLNAPILLPRNADFVVVAGFRRIAACRFLGWESISARCLPSHAEPVQCALAAVADNLTQRHLDLVETARALNLLEQAGGGPQAVVPLANSIGLAVNRELAAKLKRVLQMDETLQRALVDGGIALPVALRLQEMPDGAAAKELAALFRELQLSLNRQREILEWVQAIAGREAIAPQAVITTDPIAQWRQDLRIDKGQKTQLIRDYLKKRRFPQISAFEARYQQGVKGLKLIEGMQLSAPAHFEGQTYTLHLTFKTAVELERLCREAGRVATSSALADLLNPIFPVD